jgi:hypothetical protein
VQNITLDEPAPAQDQDQLFEGELLRLPVALLEKLVEVFV